MAWAVSSVLTDTEWAGLCGGWVLPARPVYAANVCSCLCVVYVWADKHGNIFTSSGPWATLNDTTLFRFFVAYSMRSFSRWYRFMRLRAIPLSGRGVDSRLQSSCFSTVPASVVCTTHCFVQAAVIVAFSSAVVALVTCDFCSYYCKICSYHYKSGRVKNSHEICLWQRHRSLCESKQERTCTRS